MAAKSWEASVEKHMDKVGYLLEDKIPYHLNRLMKLSDTPAMEQAVNVMMNLQERFVKALDAFEEAIKVGPDDDEGAPEEPDEGFERFAGNPDDGEGDEEPDDEEEEGGEDEEPDDGQNLVDEIFGKDEE